jgi:hypothetical protein
MPFYLFDPTTNSPTEVRDLTLVNGYAVLRVTDFSITSILSPTAYTVSQDNLTISGIETATLLRISSTGTINITGLAGGSSGKTLFVHNVGINNIIFVAESASSSAANRFAIADNVTFGADQIAILQYDATSQRWRILNTGSGTVGSPGTWSETEIDFGSTPLFSKEFTVVDVTVTATNKIIVIPSGNAPTGLAVGEGEFDNIGYSAKAATGSFTLWAVATPGPVMGKRKIFYQIG